MKIDDWLIVQRGNSPLLCSIPHAGTCIPKEYVHDFSSPWHATRDADWWMPELYGFLRDMGATIVRTEISRSVIDVNRDPSGVSLYPGMATTGLCPDSDFDGAPLYRSGGEPSQNDIERRRKAFHEPYHAALSKEVIRLRELHSAILVYDCHSIRSVIPRLFPGILPNMNIGTNDGKSCGAGLGEMIRTVCEASEFSCVLNGRFKGGWITRAHGNPSSGVHAVQMELACRSYMDEPLTDLNEENWPPKWHPERAVGIQRVLRTVLTEAMNWIGTPNKTWANDV
ncbi:N-formylglutamate deformylase [Alcaligenaceae bacterium]|nr:N-formylglutamate deformylase [Alcaligenaceae bacterium]